jgi:molybdate transport system substrate-binding protein
VGRSIHRSLRALAVLALAAVALAGCSTAPADARATLTVAAAASLQGAFDEIVRGFQRENPDVRVSVVYDGTSTLVTQMLEGAPFDVIAGADEESLAPLVDARLIEEPAVFAGNTLVLVVPADGPDMIDGLDDVDDPSVRFVVCAPEVPCGRASVDLLDRAGVTVQPRSVERSVAGVLAKVATGDADAGLVYATDARGHSDVRAIVPEGAADIVNRYPIAGTVDAANPAGAAAFIDFVRGPEGRRVLTSFGFEVP